MVSVNNIDPAAVVDHNNRQDLAIAGTQWARLYVVDSTRYACCCDCGSPCHRINLRLVFFVSPVADVCILSTRGINLKRIFGKDQEIFQERKAGAVPGSSVG
jgi:hypothetical protein